MTVDTHSSNINKSVESWRETVEAEYKRVLELGATDVQMVIHQEQGDADVEVLTIFYALPSQVGPSPDGAAIGLQPDELDGAETSTTPPPTAPALPFVLGGGGHLSNGDEVEE